MKQQLVFFFEPSTFILACDSSDACCSSGVSFAFDNSTPFIPGLVIVDPGQPELF